MSHLAALTNTGDLYMWGCNKFGSLGLGDLKDQYFPLKVKKLYLSLKNSIVIKNDNLYYR